MIAFYSGWQARRYDRLWRTFSARTHAVTLALVDFAALGDAPARLGRPARALDAGCGTGTLLRALLGRVPALDVYGVDASEEMLAQARAALGGQPNVHLARATLGAGETANLPYAPATFDLITCTNLLHYLPEPAATLAGLRRLLAPDGQLVLEDFVRRRAPFPWPAFEWLVRRLDAGHVRAYTLAEARTLCARAGLRIVGEPEFVVDWLWRGWALRASPSAA